MTLCCELSVVWPRQISIRRTLVPINLGEEMTALTTVIDTNYRGIAVRSDVTIREWGFTRGSEMWKNQKRHDKHREGQEQNKEAGAACWNNDHAPQDLYVDIEKRPGKKCPLSVTLLSVVLSWPCRRWWVSRNESRFNAMCNDRAPRTDGSSPRQQILGVNRTKTQGCMSFYR